MKHVTYVAIICGFLAMNISGLSFAKEHLDANTLVTLIKGNTVEGVKVKWKTTYKTYFDSTGKYRRIDSNNNRDKGEWEIKKDGSLCMTGGKGTKCRWVNKRNEDSYEVTNLLDKLIWTITKVSPGDPYGLWK